MSPGRAILPSPAPPCCPTVRRPDPTGRWCVRLLGSKGGVYIGFPGHALHTKCLQRQIGICKLVSSQKRRVIFVPLVNCRLTGCQRRVLFLCCFFSDFPCMERVDKNKKASFHWSEARNEGRLSSRWSTVDKLVVNGGSRSGQATTLPFCALAIWQHCPDCPFRSTNNLICT